MEGAGKIEEVPKSVGKARSKGKSIGLVPTMGALHAGHVSLIKAAVDRCDFVVVSIFINPTQFEPTEDLDNYPKDLDGDVKICTEAGADLVFAPGVNEMYADKNITWVTVEKLTENLCGRFRPIHFRGVTTVCTKLFNIVLPDVAFFGQKDAQQAIVIKRMVADLNMPLEIEICPTVREADGLAVSSRNQYLSDAERKAAALLYAALRECEKMATGGCRESAKLIEAMRQVVSKSPGIDIEYISIVNIETLEDIDLIEDMALAALAAKIGSTRLIDNILVDLSKH